MTTATAGRENPKRRNLLLLQAESEAATAAAATAAAIPNRNDGSDDSNSRKGKTGKTKQKKISSSSDSNGRSSHGGGKDKKKIKRYRRRTLFDDEDGESVTGMTRQDMKYSRFLLHFKKKLPEEVVESEERLLHMTYHNSMSMSYYHDYCSISMSIPNDISDGSEGTEEDK